MVYRLLFEPTKQLVDKSDKEKWNHNNIGVRCVQEKFVGIKNKFTFTFGLMLWCSICRYGCLMLCPCFAINVYSPETDVVYSKYSQ